MKIKFRISDFGFRIDRKGGRLSRFAIRNPQSAIRQGAAFSLIEIMVVVSLLSLIVLALMAVFSSTQRAFRAAVTQTDVLEGSRATMELMASDLRSLTPSYGVSNVVNGPVNFAVLANVNYSPLLTALPGASTGVQRTNLLNYFFVLGRNNTRWTATGYIVNTASTNPICPLYRFYEETNTTYSPWGLINDFRNASYTNMSHLIDGVVHLTLRAYDTNGYWINNNSLPLYSHALNTEYLFPPAVGNAYGEAQLYMYSNAVPAALELELGVLEDRALARAVSLPFQSSAQLNYLSQQSGALHLFHQRVTIPNVDPTAYQ